MPLLRWLALSLVLLATPACGWLTREAQTVTVPLQDARNLYAKARVIYLTRYERDQAKCDRRELSAAECQELARVHEQAIRADFLIRAKLDSPKSELDTDNLMLLLNLAAGLRP